MITYVDSVDFLSLYQKKEEALLEKFTNPDDPQKVYETLIFLGKTLPKPQYDIEKEENLVEGCQSLAYIASSITQEGTVFYQIHSEALISAGLAFILFFIYQNESPLFILKNPPLFIQKLGLHTSLSPGRSNGLASLYARMKQDALKLFVSMEKNHNY